MPRMRPSRPSRPNSITTQCTGRTNSASPRPSACASRSASASSAASTIAGSRAAVALAGLRPANSEHSTLGVGDLLQLVDLDAARLRRSPPRLVGWPPRRMPRSTGGPCSLDLLVRLPFGKPPHAHGEAPRRREPARSRRTIAGRLQALLHAVARTPRRARCSDSAAALRCRARPGSRARLVAMRSQAGRCRAAPCAASGSRALRGSRSRLPRRPWPARARAGCSAAARSPKSPCAHRAG